MQNNFSSEIVACVQAPYTFFNNDYWKSIDWGKWKGWGKDMEAVKVRMVHQKPMHAPTLSKFT